MLSRSQSSRSRASQLWFFTDLKFLKVKNFPISPLPSRWSRFWVQNLSQKLRSSQIFQIWERDYLKNLGKSNLEILFLFGIVRIFQTKNKRDFVNNFFVLFTRLFVWLILNTKKTCRKQNLFFTHFFLNFIKWNLPIFRSQIKCIWKSI